LNRIADPGYTYDAAGNLIAEPLFSAVSSLPE